MDAEKEVHLSKIVRDGKEIKEIVFDSLQDMRVALGELKNGKSIIGIYESPYGLRAEIIPQDINSLIQDGKMLVSANVREWETKKEKGGTK